VNLFTWFAVLLLQFVSLLLIVVDSTWLWLKVGLLASQKTKNLAREKILRECSDKETDKGAPF
jgi:hypothetical protein